MMVVVMLHQTETENPHLREREAVTEVGIEIEKGKGVEIRTGIEIEGEVEIGKGDEVRTGNAVVAGARTRRGVEARKDAGVETEVEIRNTRVDHQRDITNVV